MTYRKIGGIHWLSLGPWRFSWCRVSRDHAMRQAMRKVEASAKALGRVR